MVKVVLRCLAVRLDTISACDGQTPHEGKDRAMQSVAQVNMELFSSHGNNSQSFSLM